MTHTHDREIHVAELARVEGEGAMHVSVTDGVVDDVRLEIYEPPRFFEAFLRGRHFTEPPDITARICGICPVAYQMSCINAIESLCRVEVPDGTRQLRRLLYCGEWIESHVLHVFMLHAPDFLGYASALDLAADEPDLVSAALRMRKIGNEILEVVGGRAIHPVNVRVGGFHRAPTASSLRALLPELQWALDTAVAATERIATFDFPDLEHPHLYVSLLPEPEDVPPGATSYPIERGRVVSSDGLDVPVEEWPHHFYEHQVGHSTAMHASTSSDETFMVGPTARFALAADRLSPTAADLAKRLGVTPPERNPFRSILVRMIELVHCYEEAMSLIEHYRPPADSWVPVEPVAGTGHGATEAPRGLLYHRYTLDEEGLITDAVIVPPTSQNQTAVEEDLVQFVQANLALPDEQLQWQCEQAIRNYDPCISCSTHFLDLTVERR